MAHRLNIESIHQSVLLLLNLCYAAKTYAQTHDLSTYDKADSVGGPYYVGWLKATLSDADLDWDSIHYDVDVF